MNILTVNGSPRAQGFSIRMAEAFLQGANGGNTGRLLHAYALNAYACTDCRACLGQSGCRIKDQGSLFYQALEKADALVLASPLHFNALSAPLAALISRCQTYWNRRFRTAANQGPMPQLKGIFLLASAGSGYPHQFEGAFAQARALSLTLQSRLLGAACQPVTDRMPEGPLPKEELSALQERGRRFAAQCQQP